MDSLTGGILSLTGEVCQTLNEPAPKSPGINDRHAISVLSFIDAQKFDDYTAK